MEPLNIRQFLTQDAKTLAQIYLDARRKAFHWIAPETFQLEDFTEDTINESIFVAGSPGSPPLAFLSLWEPDTFIHHLYVAPNAQRCGYGAALIDHVKRLYPDLSLKCLLRNEAALRFYEKQGFLNTGERGRSDHGEWVWLYWERPV